MVSLTFTGTDAESTMNISLIHFIGRRLRPSLLKQIVSPLGSPAKKAQIGGRGTMHQGVIVCCLRAQPTMELGV